jgi:hypothetical protein
MLLFMPSYCRCHSDMYDDIRLHYGPAVTSQLFWLAPLSDEILVVVTSHKHNFKTIPHLLNISNDKCGGVWSPSCSGLNTAGVRWTVGAVQYGGLSVQFSTVDCRYSSVRWNVGAVQYGGLSVQFSTVDCRYSSVRWTGGTVQYGGLAVQFSTVDCRYSSVRWTVGTVHYPRNRALYDLYNRT